MRAFKKKNTSKPLELEGPSKKESEEISQPSLKDDLPKDWQFKKAHPQDLIIGDIGSQLKYIVNLDILFR